MSLISRTAARVRHVSFDALVNLVILATCAIVAVAVTERWRARPTTDAHGSAPLPFTRGDQAEALPDLRYADAPMTLVLYLRSTCPYCSASMPFYRRLREASGAGGGPRLVAVSPEPMNEFKAYLEKNQMNVDHIVASSLKPHPTPTLVLVDSAGIVRGVWLGQQSKDGEQEVLSSIAQRSARSSPR
jgi:hypothetical protein